MASLAGAALGLWYWRRRFRVVHDGPRGTIHVDDRLATAAEGVI
jgi:hypothetical protein